MRYVIRFLLVFVLLGAFSTSFAEDDRDVEKAVRDLRNLGMEEILETRRTNPVLAQTQWNEKVKIIESSWNLLEADPERGIAEIEKELARLEESKETDHFFKLNVTNLLWKMKGMEKADIIGKTWESTSLGVQSNYVFFPAFEAARTQSPQALPMLLPILGERGVGVVIARHAMPVYYPLTLEFIWGSYGTQGLAPALEVLKNSSHTNKRVDAMLVLSRAYYVEALPIIREYVGSSDLQLKSQAIRSLGIYAYPDDQEIIIKELKNTDQEMIKVSCLWALGEGEFKTATLDVIPFLSDSSEQVRIEARTCLSLFSTQESIEALVVHGKTTTFPKDKEKMEVWIKNLEDRGLAGAKYEKLSPEKKQERFAKLIPSYPKPMERSEFISLIEASTKNKRLPSNWNALLVISSANPEDLPLLVDLRASLYQRLSDEALIEVRTLNHIIQEVGRKGH
jgi:FOG: HEAT repeat